MAEDQRSTIRVVFDGTSTGLGIVSPLINSGKPAFVGTEGSDAVTVATKLLQQGLTAG